MALTDAGNTPLTPSSQAGIESFTQSVAGGTRYVDVVMSPSGQVLGVGSCIAPSTPANIPGTVLNTLNATVGTLAAGKVTGAQDVTLLSSNATPGAQTVRTAAQMFADTPNAFVGFSWALRITNTGAGTLTLTADAGPTVTLTGTMTVLQNTFRDFVCTFTSATAATITTTGTGTYS